MLVLVVLCAVGLLAGSLLLWRAPRCDAAKEAFETSVSIVIPARDEERNLPRILGSITQAGVTPAEVLVVDDGSADNTAAVAASFGARVLTSADKPSQWTGKSWACYQGAQAARGELLLFLDADTYFIPGGLERIVACWLRERNKRRVLSILPYHAMNALYEQCSLFFNLLMAAGAGGFGALAQAQLFGQCLLIPRSLYFEAGGHAAVPGVVLENLRWATKLRSCGARVICFAGRGALHMRMFPDGAHQMTESWAKAFTQGAVDSGPKVLAASVVWISALWSTTLLLVMPPVHGYQAALAVYLLMGLQIAFVARQLGTYHILTCLLFPFPLAYFCLVFGRATARRVLGRKTYWRGRQV
jgi:4,4'-diaponeurosporenoate glycosyltransferase